MNNKAEKKQKKESIATWSTRGKARRSEGILCCRKSTLFCVAPLPRQPCNHKRDSSKIANRTLSRHHSSLFIMEDDEDDMQHMDEFDPSEFEVDESTFLFCSPTDGLSSRQIVLKHSRPQTFRIPRLG